MPNRGQTQDQGKRGRNPGTQSPDDDETVQNEANQRQAGQQQAQRRRGNPAGTPEVESDASDAGLGDEADDDDGVGGRQ